MDAVRCFCVQLVVGSVDFGNPKLGPDEELKKKQKKTPLKHEKNKEVFKKKKVSTKNIRRKIRKTPKKQEKTKNAFLVAPFPKRPPSGVSFSLFRSS